MIEIDGSYGEGGGQILRTALSLSCLTGRAFRIAGIRKERKKPGLRPQHLTAVRAAVQLCGAQAQGDAPGSTELLFSPGTVRNGEFSFDIGTAGSTTLLLQTLVLPLLFAGGRSSIVVTGGTHVPFSPSYHYLDEVFAPMLARLGGRITLLGEAFGFYPRGGGRLRCLVEPAQVLAPIVIEDPGRLQQLTGVSAVCNLPISIARRQSEAARAVLAEAEVEADTRLAEVAARGKGTFLFLKGESEGAISGFTALGAPGKQAEAVGEEAAREFLRYRSSGAAIDPHLADQLIPYLALASGASSFTTSCITRHLLTNLWVTERFLPFRFTVEGDVGRPGRIRLVGGR